MPALGNSAWADGRRPLVQESGGQGLAYGTEGFTLCFYLNNAGKQK